MVFFRLSCLKFLIFLLTVSCLFQEMGNFLPIIENEENFLSGQGQFVMGMFGKLKMFGRLNQI